jgi:pyruvate dehydrogenase E1 component alpha subunit
VIKSAGHLIGPFEVESVLMEHPAVAEAGVIGKPDPMVGEGGQGLRQSLKRGIRAERSAAPGMLGHARKRLGAAVAPKEIAFLPTCRALAAARSCAACSRPANWACPKATPRRWRPWRMSEAPDRPGAERPAAARSASAPVSGAVPAAPTGPVRWDKAFALKVLADMVRIRRMEERAPSCTGKQKIRGFLHLYIGEEAVAAGSLNALRAEDNVGRHLPRARPRAGARAVDERDHGRDVRQARGLRARPGRLDAPVRPRHAAVRRQRDRRRRPAAGRRPGAGRQDAGPARVTACFFGDGAVAEGAFHESLNLAALWKLPVLFCCENNLYAMGTAIERYESQTDLCVKASSYGMPATRIDGMDVVAVREATQAAAEFVRDGGGPMFLEYRTYRFRAHSMYDAELYRDQGRGQRMEAAGPDCDLRTGPSPGPIAAR